MFVQNFFRLASGTVSMLRSLKPNFGFDGFGEFIFYRTYSRMICKSCRKPVRWKEMEPFCPDCNSGETAQENWADCVIRVTEGVFSIRKDWYIKNSIQWDEDHWQHYAAHFAKAMFDMHWMPPGRGCWAMGTQYIYERGSMALQNCGWKIVTNDIGSCAHWIMDALMNGVGIGFAPTEEEEVTIYQPHQAYDHVISDDKEGWCDSVKALIDAYIRPDTPLPNFKYHLIRKANTPIRGFGGVASGPESLKYLHETIVRLITKFTREPGYSTFMLKTDIVNSIGVCVVAGNVRRSAELLAGTYASIIDMKNYAKYPYRKDFGWMSNNSVYLDEPEDFMNLDAIAERIKDNGEPGIINLRNIGKWRIGKVEDGVKYGLRHDKATGFNPCGEQPLEDNELCTLAETCPTRCVDENGELSLDDWLRACEFATFYATTVTLLPTHRPETNRVMLKNRRIGVSLVDVSGWVSSIGTTRLIAALRYGYARVRSVNRWLSTESGTPEGIRVTTLKPGGTIPKLTGGRAGWQWPTFGYTLRRVNVGVNTPVFKLLVDAGVPHEPSVTSHNTEVFEFPIDQSMGGRVKPATEISIYKQAMMLILLQREWADNAVSNTIYFKPKWVLTKDINVGNTLYASNFTEEVQAQIKKYLPISLESLLVAQEYETDNTRVLVRADDYSDDWHILIYRFDPNHEEDEVGEVLAGIAPLIKSAALLPHQAEGVYPQMPESSLTLEQYNARRKAMREINWAKFSGSDGIDERYCEGGVCIRGETP